MESLHSDYRKAVGKDLFFGFFWVLKGLESMTLRIILEMLGIMLCINIALLLNLELKKDQDIKHVLQELDNILQDFRLLKQLILLLN